MYVSPSLSAVALANVRSQVIGSLLGSTPDFSSYFDAAYASPFVDTAGTTSNLLSAFMPSSATQASALSAGRNMALYDPESAYKMMTLINNKDVLYKAQYAELSQMGEGIAKMEAAGKSLGASISPASSNADIKAALQDFVTRYNEWQKRFNPDMQKDGLLAGTQAAQVARYELEQSVKNIFFGAKDGVRGMAALGISVDPVNGSLTLDSAKLDAMLASGKQSVVGTIQEFSANFAKSANLLNADNNFIPNQLDNLDRVIDYIADNGTDLRAEFGTGDAAKPTGQIAQALAAYNRNYAE
jgi:hypothetical protein